MRVKKQLKSIGHRLASEDASLGQELLRIAGSTDVSQQWKDWREQNPRRLITHQPKNGLSDLRENLKEELEGADEEDIVITRKSTAKDLADAARQLGWDVPAFIQTACEVCGIDFSQVMEEAGEPPDAYGHSSTYNVENGYCVLKELASITKDKSWLEISWEGWDT